MAQILHKRATTTHAIRAEIQRSADSVATLSRRYGINLKTVRKWRNRDTVEDTRMGPSPPTFCITDASEGSRSRHLPAEDPVTP
ncbi:hypothetical protein DFO67_11059 [Modicisalibacter xianhensis]|uniref:Uncharacterized protein n=1 Tax=Modicisalibacter xianhensis TaxID=442341 RepID=A0A4V6QAS2_9GAMM|nr:hypothetical protein DFO67_11059 [Halomonas xianhensis]